MIIVETPNRWSCLPCAFATATDTPLEKILRVIGHDGSEIIWYDLSEPECRRSFVGTELVKAMYQLGYLATRFDTTIDISQDEERNLRIDDTEFVKGVMTFSIGVITGIVRSTGKWHAVAWDGLRCLDPNGFIYPLEKFEMHSYYLVTRISL